MELIKWYKDEIQIILEIYLLRFDARSASITIYVGTHSSHYYYLSDDFTLQDIRRNIFKKMPLQIELYLNIF